MFRWLKSRAPAADAAPEAFDGETVRRQGDALLHADDLAGAAACYLQVIARDPGDASALTSLGFVRLRQGQVDDALRLLGRAAALESAGHDPHYMLGTLHEERGELELAITHLGRAVALAPGFDLAVRDLGRVLFKAGRAAEARATLEAGIARNPAFADHHLYLGHLQGAAGETTAAAASYTRATQIDAGHASAHFELGNLQRRLGQAQAAVASYEAALAADPAHAQAANHLGETLRTLGQPALAEAACRRALAIDPSLASAHNNLGNALVELKRASEALPCYERAAALRPDFADALVNRGHALNVLGRPHDAVAAYELARAIDAGTAWLCGAWLHTRMRICDWRELDAAFAELARRIDGGERAAVPFTMLGVPLTAGQQLRCASTYVESLGFAPARPLEGHAPHERIRLGYFSADFHDHATAFLMAEMFERHDRERFEVIAFSFGPRSQSPMRARLEAGFDRFIDVAGLSDAQIVERGRALQIDIAIDLKGFTEDSRTGVFAGRVAPVQVSFIGYPGTMGAPFIDYLLADATVVPLRQADTCTEKIAFMPHSYQVNDSQRRISQRVFTRAEAGLPEDGFVFCCFNNNYKITPDAFDVWMRLLQAVPRSVLWLLQDNPHAASNLRAEAAARGVDPGRLVFAQRMPLPDHLARHRLADLFLDTFHCNAHTTASDALWAGLPVLTRLGNTFAGRVAGSLLRATGLDELVVETTGDYERLAMALAADPARLAALRERLDRQRSSCPLFDAARFTRNAEAAYEAMWQRQRAGLAPEHIHVVESGGAA